MGIDDFAHPPNVVGNHGNTHGRGLHGNPWNTLTIGGKDDQSGRSQVGTYVIDRSDELDRARGRGQILVGEGVVLVVLGRADVHEAGSIGQRRRQGQKVGTSLLSHQPSHHHHNGFRGGQRRLRRGHEAIDDDPVPHMGHLRG